MEQVRERILLVFKHFATNINKFSNGDKALRNRLTRQINNNAAITIDTIDALLSKYPEISAEWLIRGRGNMIFTDSLSFYTGNETEREIDYKIAYDKLKALYDLEVEKNEDLTGDINYLEKYNQRLSFEKIKLEESLSKYEPQKKDII